MGAEPETLGLTVCDAVDKLDDLLGSVVAGGCLSSDEYRPCDDRLVRVPLQTFGRDGKREKESWSGRVRGDQCGTHGCTW